MFDIFQNHFKESFSIANVLLDLKGIPFKYSELLLACGGKTYDNGLYAIHTFENSVKWSKLLKSYFPKLDFDFICFGYDWLGTQFCVPIGIGEYILCFDPATQKDSHIVTNLIDFHDNLLVNNKADFFSLEYFHQILDNLKIDTVPHNKCLGLKTSLFLGAEDNAANYSVCNMEVHWEFENQIFNQISGLPNGTKINKVTIDPLIGGKS